jgi:hypothetical protein
MTVNKGRTAQFQFIPRGVNLGTGGTSILRLGEVDDTTQRTIRVIFQATGEGVFT